MSAKLLIGTWISDSSIVSLVGRNRAYKQLPQSATFPALVYTIPSCIPRPNVNFRDGSNLMECRVQFNPIAKTLGEVEAIEAALKALIDFKNGTTVGGKLIMSSTLELSMDAEKDETSGLWTQPIDYKIWYYE